jgi:uncharacterized protein YdaU (DUF1376 family)
MPWYIGDYLRDTAHLTTEQHGAYMLLIAHCWQHGAIPSDDQGRATVAKLSARRWKTLSATILAFFNEDGTHRRITKELERAEIVSTKRKIAGSKGGARSAIARAKRGPSLKQMAQQNSSNSLSNSHSNRVHNHNHIDTSVSDDRPSEANEEAASERATALPSGARARPGESLAELYERHRGKH